VRVLHVTTSFPRGPKDFSGAFVYRLIRAQTKLRIVCHVLCPFSGNLEEDWPKDFKVYRFKYTSDPSNSLTGIAGGIPTALKMRPSLYLQVPNFLFKLGQHVVRLSKDVDIIHAHWSICGAICGITKKFHNLPIVTTLRGSDIHRAKSSSLYNLLHKICVKNSSALVGVSKSLLDELIDLDPRCQDKAFFIPNGVDQEFYNIPLLKRIEYPIRFLFIGSLIELKQVDLLISALSLIKEDRHKWLLSIAGDGPMRSSLERLCMKLGVEESCVFLGNIAPSDIPNLIGRHHVLVLPSKREGRPNVVIEAMACARLVITSDIKACRELIIHKKNGLLFKAGSPDGLYKILKEVIENPHIISSLGESARDWMIKKDLTWPNCAKRYIELYREILEKH